MRMRKWSPLRWMLMPLQRCLGGTNRDCEYNWVILMHGPQGLCDLKGLFCWGQPARGWLQNHQISHCFLLRWCCQFLAFQGGYFEENLQLFFLTIVAQQCKWNDEKMQVSFRFYAVFILQYLFWYAYSFGHLFLLHLLFMLFSVSINRKMFQWLNSRLSAEQ